MLTAHPKMIEKAKAVADRLPGIGLSPSLSSKISDEIRRDVDALVAAARVALEALKTGVFPVEAALAMVDDLAALPVWNMLTRFAELAHYQEVREILSDDELPGRLEIFEDVVRGGLARTLRTFADAEALATAHPREVDAALQRHEFRTWCLTRQIRALVGFAMLEGIAAGGSDPELARPIAHALARIGNEHLALVRSALGRDERRTGEIPLSFFDTVGPQDPTGSVRKAVLDERESGF